MKNISSITVLGGPRAISSPPLIGEGIGSGEKKNVLHGA